MDSRRAQDQLHITSPLQIPPTQKDSREGSTRGEPDLSRPPATRNYGRLRAVSPPFDARFIRGGGCGIIDGGPQDSVAGGTQVAEA